MKYNFKHFIKIPYLDRWLITNFMIEHWEADHCPNCGIDTLRYRWTRGGFGPEVFTDMDTGIHRWEYMCENCMKEWDHDRSYKNRDFRRFFQEKLFALGEDKAILIHRVLKPTLWERIQIYFGKQVIPEWACLKRS